MRKYILTKDFQEITETYGLFQNSSGDANIEITNNINEQGILLKPFQKVTLNQKVYARKLAGGGGTAQLIVLPFNSEIDSTEEVDSGENYFDENLNRPRKNRRSYPREQPPPFPPMFPQDNSTPAVVDCNGFYMLKIPKNSLNGQNKFLVQINDSKGND